MAMRLEHEKRGAGEPLVLLHGIGHYHRGWAPVLGRLARHHEVFAVDLPGHGGSLTLSDGAPTLPRLAAAVTSFMAEQGHARFHVAGVSLGGGVALELARGDAALSACAISPIGFWATPGRVWLNTQLRLTRASSRALIPVIDRFARSAAFRRWSTRVPLAARSDRLDAAEFAEQVRQVAYAPGFEATRVATLQERFARGEELRCPVTVAWGDHDLLLTYRTQSRRARAALPQATHVTIHGGGHIPALDDPDRVAEVILAAAATSASASPSS
jgi:pimeloyl-ACP methyl ester carboxylesterase